MVVTCHLHSIIARKTEIGVPKVSPSDICITSFMALRGSHTVPSYKGGINRLQMNKNMRKQDWHLVLQSQESSP